MTELTLEILHAELTPIRADVAALRTDLTDTRHELRNDIVRLEAKIDSKPGLVAMFGAILVVVLGFASVAVGTVTTLNTLGYIHAPAKPAPAAGPAQ